METQDPILPKITPSSPEEVEAYNQREWDRVSLEILTKASFPPAYADKTGMALYQRHPGWHEAFLAVQELLKKDPPSKVGKLIAITGGWSVGKTTMAVETLRHQAKTNHRSVYFSTLSDYLQRLTSTGRSGDYSLLAEDFEDRGILVLDDVMQTDRDWELKALHMLVIKRHNFQKDTILTSTLEKAQDLQQILPPGIIPRLNLTRTSKVIHLDYPGFNA